MPLPFMNSEGSFPLVQAVGVFAVRVRRVHSIPAMGGSERGCFILAKKSGSSKPVLKSNRAKSGDIPAAQALRGCRRKRLTEQTA